MMGAEHTHTCEGIFLTVTVANNDETENLQAMCLRGTSDYQPPTWPAEHGAFGVIDRVRTFEEVLAKTRSASE